MQQRLVQAIEVEVETFLAALKDLKLTDGRARVVRHGRGPARTIQTEVAWVKIRDRARKQPSRSLTGLPPPERTWPGISPLRCR